MSFRYDLIHFYWQRCPDGYRIVKGAELPAPKEHETVLTQEVPPGWAGETVVRSNTDVLETYNPMSDEPELVRRFLDMRGGKTGALAFAVEYGLPGGEIGNMAKEMSVKSFSRFLANAKSVCRGKKRSPARLFLKYSQRHGRRMKRSSGYRLISGLRKSVNSISFRAISTISSSFESLRS